MVVRMVKMRRMVVTMEVMVGGSGNGGAGNGGDGGGGGRDNASGGDGGSGDRDGGVGGGGGEQWRVGGEIMELMVVMMVGWIQVEVKVVMVVGGSNGVDGGIGGGAMEPMEVVIWW